MISINNSTLKTKTGTLIKNDFSYSIDKGITFLPFNSLTNEAIIDLLSSSSLDNISIDGIDLNKLNPIQRMNFISNNIYVCELFPKRIGQISVKKFLAVRRINYSFIELNVLDKKLYQLTKKEALIINIIKASNKKASILLIDESLSSIDYDDDIKRILEKFNFEYVVISSNENTKKIDFTTKDNGIERSFDRPKLTRFSSRKIIGSIINTTSIILISITCSLANLTDSIIEASFLKNNQNNMIIESNNPQMILDEMSDKGLIMYKGYSNSARESLSTGINLLSCSKVCFSNIKSYDKIRSFFPIEEEFIYDASTGLPSSYKIAYGRLPNKENEIAITDYQYEIFKNFSFVGNNKIIEKEDVSFDNILDNSIPSSYGDLNICGIIDTEFRSDEYQNLINYSLGQENYDIDKKIKESTSFIDLYNSSLINAKFVSENIYTKSKESISNQIFRTHDFNNIVLFDFTSLNLFKEYNESNIKEAYIFDETKFTDNSILLDYITYGKILKYKNLLPNDVSITIPKSIITHLDSDELVHVNNLSMIYDHIRNYAIKEVAQNNYRYIYDNKLIDFTNFNSAFDGSKESKILAIENYLQSSVFPIFSLRHEYEDLVNQLDKAIMYQIINLSSSVAQSMFDYNLKKDFVIKGIVPSSFSIISSGSFSERQLYRENKMKVCYDINNMSLKEVSKITNICNSTNSKYYLANSSLFFKTKSNIDSSLTTLIPFTSIFAFVSYIVFPLYIIISTNRNKHYYHYVIFKEFFFSQINYITKTINRKNTILTIFSSVFTTLLCILLIKTLAFKVLPLFNYLLFTGLFLSIGFSIITNYLIDRLCIKKICY